MHRVNLENIDIRSDLISDFDVKKVDNFEKRNIKIERVNLNAKDASFYKKKKGKYISIIFDDVTDSERVDEIIETLSIELKNILISKNILGKSSLIIGLGNSHSTPDSLGPKVIDNIITTRHINDINELEKKYSIVSKIAPGVYAVTGIETFDIIKGISSITNPDYVIIIDSLASNSIEKLNKVIQLTDAGIEPGSGVGNQRKEISKNTLGIDVITIGVPTVVNLHTIVKDFLEEYDIDDLLKEKGNNFMVTPKEIDFVIDKLSYIISKAINDTLHNLTK